jgi:hypothetical protein
MNDSVWGPNTSRLGYKVHFLHLLVPNKKLYADLVLRQSLLGRPHTIRSSPEFGLGG